MRVLALLAFVAVTTATHGGHHEAVSQAQASASSNTHSIGAGLGGLLNIGLTSSNSHAESSAGAKSVTHGLFKREANPDILGSSVAQSQAKASSRSHTLGAGLGGLLNFGLTSSNSHAESSAGAQSVTHGLFKREANPDILGSSVAQSQAKASSSSHTLGLGGLGGLFNVGLTSSNSHAESSAGAQSVTHGLFKREANPDVLGSSVAQSQAKASSSSHTLGAGLGGLLNIGLTSSNSHAESSAGAKSVTHGLFKREANPDAFGSSVAQSQAKASSSSHTLGLGGLGGLFNVGLTSSNSIAESSAGAQSVTHGLFKREANPDIVGSSVAQSQAKASSSSHTLGLGRPGQLFNPGYISSNSHAESSAGAQSVTHSLFKREANPDVLGSSVAQSQAKASSSSHTLGLGELGGLFNVGLTSSNSHAESSAGAQSVTHGLFKREANPDVLGSSVAQSQAKASSSSHTLGLGGLGGLFNVGLTSSNSHAESSAGAQSVTHGLFKREANPDVLGSSVAQSQAKASSSSHTLGLGGLGGLFNVGLTSSNAHAESSAGAQSVTHGLFKREANPDILGSSVAQSQAQASSSSHTLGAGLGGLLNIGLTSSKSHAESSAGAQSVTHGLFKREANPDILGSSVAQSQAKASSSSHSLGLGGLGGLFNVGLTSTNSHAESSAGAQSVTHGLFKREARLEESGGLFDTLAIHTGHGAGVDLNKHSDIMFAKPVLKPTEGESSLQESGGLFDTLAIHTGHGAGVDLNKHSNIIFAKPIPKPTDELV